MPPEKASDPRSQTPQQRNAEAILARLNDYLSVRFDLAGRINAALRAVKQDLIYHELTNVRRCLLGDKIYGPSRQYVADVFLGDDDKKRRGLMSPTDQTSIQVELVSHCQDERVEATRGQIRIHDLKSFYAAIDPALSNLMDLVETWIWWDIMDAAELVRFEQKLTIITVVRQGRLSEDARKRYGVLIHPATEDGTVTSVTDEDVIRYEFKFLGTIRDQWLARRQAEHGYMYVLKRDELPAANKGELIHQIAERVREYDTIRAKDELTDDDRHLYAGDLRLAPDKVTREAVLEFIQGLLLNNEREMVKQVENEAQLGPPYNYKERQLEQMNRWLDDLAQQLQLRPAAPAAPPAAAKA